MSESEHAMNETSITIVGNVTSDIKTRRTAEGHRVVSFRVASNERRFDKESGDWVDGGRLFVNVTCWRRLANGVSMSLSKGDPVIVTGRLYTRDYELEGQKRSVTEMLATAVGPDLSRCAAELLRVRRPAAEAAAGEVGADAEAVAAANQTSNQNGAPRDAHLGRERRQLGVVAVSP